MTFNPFRSRGCVGYWCSWRRTLWYRAPLTPPRPLRPCRLHTHTPMVPGTCPVGGALGGPTGRVRDEPSTDTGARSATTSRCATGRIRWRRGTAAAPSRGGRGGVLCGSRHVFAVGQLGSPVALRIALGDLLFPRPRSTLGRVRRPLPAPAGRRTVVSPPRRSAGTGHRTARTGTGSTRWRPAASSPTTGRIRHGGRLRVAWEAVWFRNGPHPPHFARRVPCHRTAARRGRVAPVVDPGRRDGLRPADFAKSGS